MGSKNTSRKVKKAIKNSGQSQAEVADKAGMSKKHLHRIKTGIVDPSIKALARIGHAVGKKLSDLKKHKR